MNHRTHTTGAGFVGLLTIALIILKLLGKIDWSWWWVLSPVWISWALVLFILIVAFLFIAWKSR